MFNLFWLKTKKKSKIDAQVQVFLKWRKRRRMSVVDYEEWLNLFLSMTDKQDVYDVSAVDVLQYLNEVEPLCNGSQYRLRRAETALRQFKRFYSARGRMMRDLADYNDILRSEGVNYASDMKRNKEIVELYLADRQKPPRERKWNYRNLADKYGLHWTRIGQILKKDLRKYGHNSPYYDPKMVDG